MSEAPLRKVLIYEVVVSNLCHDQRESRFRDLAKPCLNSCCWKISQDMPGSGIPTLLVRSFTVKGTFGAG